MLKKMLNCWMVATMLFVTAAMAPSCSKEDAEPEKVIEEVNPLIGTWVEDDSSVPYILTLNQDNSGSIEFSSATRASIAFYQYFRWSQGVASTGVTYVNILTTSGDEILSDGRYEYTVIGNKMEFGGLRFTRR